MPPGPVDRRVDRRLQRQSLQLNRPREHQIRPAGLDLDSLLRMQQQLGVQLPAELGGCDNPEPRVELGAKLGADPGADPGAEPGPEQGHQSGELGDLDRDLANR